MIRTDRAGLSPGELLGRRLGLPSPQIAESLAHWLKDARSYPAGAEICPPDGALASPQLVTSGWVGEVCQLSDGRRQYVALRLPGDTIGVAPGPQAFATVALTDVETVDAGRLMDRLREPAPALEPLRRAWARTREAEQRQLADHVVRLGRLSAMERTAHLLLELHQRLLHVGLATPQTFHLPLTQETLGDVLGLSIVHVNRTMQQLRREGVASRRAGMMTVPDRARLAALAGHSRPSAEAARPAGPAPRRAGPILAS